MANFCPHCGAQLPRPGAAFCATCGRSLQARPTTAGVSPSAAPQLRIQLPGRAEETFVIARPRVTIGRDPGNDLVLDSPIVSRRHAELEAVSYTHLDVYKRQAQWAVSRPTRPGSGRTKRSTSLRLDSASGSSGR